MPKFVIERTLPGAGELTAQQLQWISRTSVDVLEAMAGRAQWLESYVTDDKLYCVYIADDAETAAEHAKAGGFPCDSARRVRSIIDPTTAEASP
jgi:Protein of unknown function (DUF4242)